VIGFLESPYYLDVVPYTSSFPGFLYEEQQKYLLFNTVGLQLLLDIMQLIHVVEHRDASCICSDDRYSV
jgi:hypothetical protein